MEQIRWTFGKDKRVTGRERVGRLFKDGKGFIAFPFRVSYLLCEREEQGAALLVSVPKRRLKRAVDRNRVKRLAREAFRLNQHLLQYDLLPEGYGVDVALVYVKNEVASYKEVEAGVKKGLDMLNKRLGQPVEDKEED